MPSNGYVLIKRTGHPLADVYGYVPEHRMLAWDAGLLVDVARDVHHSNENKTDNRLENLEVLTKAEHARRHGNPIVHLTGEQNGRAKLTSDDVLAIRSRYAAGGTSQSDLGRQYGVGQAQISRIVHGTDWAHLVSGSV